MAPLVKVINDTFVIEQGLMSAIHSATAKQKAVDAILATDGMRALILESFGCGNAPSSPWFVNRIKTIILKGVVVVNVSQCNAGSVDMDAYATGCILKQAGLISAYDATFESTLAKLYFLLGKYEDNERVKFYMN